MKQKTRVAGRARDNKWEEMKDEEKGDKIYRREGERATVWGSLRAMMTAVREHRDQADMRGKKRKNRVRTGLIVLE